MNRRASDPEPLHAVSERIIQAPEVRRLIELACMEDLGVDPARRGAETLREADLTTWACASAGSTSGVIAARRPGVASGLAVLPLVIDVFGAELRIEPLATDGRPIGAGDALARVSGPRADLLAVERTMLNLVGRLSGIATRTQEFVRAIPAGSNARLHDTRKTTPGLRSLEKYAVRCGGGCSHRMGLHDAVLIKDNHLAGIGLESLGAFVSSASARARSRVPGVFVEVEVDSLEQFAEMLRLDPGTIDAVLLDNMTIEQVRSAARDRDEKRPQLAIEASGGVTLEAVPALAGAGVDRISTGAITHHAVWLDVGLDFSG